MRCTGLVCSLVAAHVCLFLGAPPAAAFGSHRAHGAPEPEREGAFEFGQAITVVIQMNGHVRITEDILHGLHALHTAYSGVFHRVVFTGQDRPSALQSHIDWTPCEHPWMFFSLCLSYVMAEFPAPEGGGHLFIGDDTLFDPCRLAELDLGKFWSPTLELVPYTPGIREDGWGEAPAALRMLACCACSCSTWAMPCS